MAWDVVTKVASLDTTSAQSWDLPSVTVSANTLLVVVTYASDPGSGGDIAVPTATGLTFTEHQRSLSAAAGLAIFSAPVGAGGFSGVITCAVHDGFDHEVLEYAVIQIDGSNEASPIVQSANFSEGSVTSMIADAGAAAGSGNLVVAAGGIQDDQTMSTDGTAAHSTVINTLSPNRSMLTAYAVGDETIGFSWTTATNARWVAIELAVGDDRNANVSWAEMETPSVPLRGQVSWTEMEVPSPGVPAAFGWEMSDLDGGGGINCVAASDDGTFLLSAGDISGPKRSLDGGVSWMNCARGLPDGGLAAATGGVAIRAGSNTEALLANKYGLFYTSDQAVTWTLVSSAVTFGDGGGYRPRQNVGRPIDAGANYAYMIELSGDVHRFNWNTQALTQDLISSRPGEGQGVAVDPQDEATFIVCTRHSRTDGTITATDGGVWKVTGATGGSPSVAAFTGAGVPADCLDVDTAVHSGTTYAFVAQWQVGAKRVAISSAANAWSNITPSGQASHEWQTIAAETDTNGNIVLGILCTDGPQLESGKYAQYWSCPNGQAATPNWTGHINLVDQKGGPGGEPWWNTTSPGPLTSNMPVRDSRHSGEGATWLYRDGRYWLMVGGQQGVFLVDRENNLLYPSVTDLGVTANGHVIADPNNPGAFLAINTDHIVIGTQDKGDTWIPLENGFPGGTMAGFDIAGEKNAPSFRWFVTFGDRTANTNGEVFVHNDPFAETDWTDLNIALSGNVPYGIEAFRAPNPQEGGSPSRTFLYLGVTSTGLRRQILNGNTKVGGLDVISNTACNSAPAGERFEIEYIDDDTLLVLDPTAGLFIVKNARAASPTIWNAWSFTNNASVGENWVSRISASRALVSIGGGSDKGLYVVGNLDTASSGQQFGGALSRTSIAKPGGGSWRRPGPAGVSPDGTKAFASDLQEQNTYPPGDCQWFQSSTAPFTSGWAETTTTDDYGLFEKVDGAAMDREGQVMVLMSGPGAATYRLGTGTPGSDDRLARVSWTEFETPLPPRGAEVSWAEVQVPNGARVLNTSWLEMEIPDYARVAQVSWAEFEAPVNTNHRRADVSYAVLEIPLSPKAAQVAWAEMEIPDIHENRAEAADYSGVSGRILVPIRWRISKPWRR